MSKYKRLTAKCEVGIGLAKTSGNIVNDYEKAVKRLAELEDKIERCRLVELPCSVGDTIYYIEYFCNYKGCSSIEQAICCGCTEMLKRESKKETYVICEKKFTLKDLSEVNKTIYLTREESEAKLKKLTEVK